MKKLKNINFKALFIDHGEKMGLGVIVLLVLVALSSTSWSRYAGTPEELDKKAKDKRAHINSPTANPWPKEKQEGFKVVDFNDRATQLFSRIDQTKYEFATPIWHPLYRKRELAREPEFLPVEFLISSAGRAILGVKPTGVSEAGSGMDAADGVEGGLNTGVAVAGTNPAAAAPGTGFKLPGAASGGGANPAGAHAPPALAPAGGAHAGGGSPMRAGAGAHAGGGGMLSGSDMYSGGMGGGGGQVAARGVRYVAVRGVFPLRQQVEKYQAALKVASAADAGLMFELLDFVLERQAAIAGPKPWDGKWETVNVESALEVLNEASDFELDPVQTGVTDAVITMSLPHRLMEFWGDHATHPNVRDFQLKPEEMERELKLQQKLLEEYEKAQLQSEPRIKRRGLSPGQNDIRAIGQEMMSSSNASSMMTGMMTSMNSENAGGGGGGGRNMTLPDIKQRLTANGRLLLFRYFDFDVQPGMAYRYRVKLKIRNPNFERPPEEVTDEAFTKDPERATDWSNISNASVIPNSVDYFLKDVERDPARDDKVRTAKAVANISLFEWDSKLGTMLSDSLRILSVGQFIAEKKKTIVVDAAAPSYKEAEEFAFNTGDVLLDAAGDYDLSPDQHPELGLKPDKGRPLAKLGLLPEAVVLTSLGELRQLDPAADKAKEQMLKKRVDDERGMFVQFKDAGAKAGGALDGAGGMYDAMMGESSAGMGKPPAKGSGSKSPRKKSGSSSSSSSPDSANASGGAAPPSSGGKPGQRRTP